MRLAVVHSRAQAGIHAPSVQVEVHLANGCLRLPWLVCQIPKFEKAEIGYGRPSKPLALISLLLDSRSIWHQRIYPKVLAALT